MDTTTVLVKFGASPNAADWFTDSTSCFGDSSVILSDDTTSCFILYPESSRDLECEISTEVATSPRKYATTVSILQTISERGFINVCKLLPGFRKVIKSFISVPYTSAQGLDTSSEDGEVITKIYCQDVCIDYIELWSPAIYYIPRRTVWTGGPCQLVSRKKSNSLIRLAFYDAIYEKIPGVYIFELHNVNRVLVWNTLPVDAKHDDWGTVAPVSYKEMLIIDDSFKGALIDEGFFATQSVMVMEFESKPFNHPIKLTYEEEQLMTTGKHITRKNTVDVS